MILTLNRNFHKYRDAQSAKTYQQLPDNMVLDSTATAVIVGVGAAGMEVARLCKQVIHKCSAAACDFYVGLFCLSMIALWLHRSSG